MRVVLGLALAAVPLACAFVFLPHLLSSTSPPAAADVIVHLAPEDPAATAYVEELFDRGLAPQVLTVSSQVSRGTFAADDARRALVAGGMPEGRVIALRLPIEDCAAPNLSRAAEFVAHSGWRSALLVAPPIGSRAMGWQARRRFAAHGVDVRLVYAPASWARLARPWWTEHRTARLVMDGVLSAILDTVYSECR